MDRLITREPKVAADIKPGTKRRSIRDAGARSLFLIIEPSGRRSWMMRFRTPSGRIGKMVLGPVDLSGREPKDEPQIGAPLTLAAARQLAAAVHRERSQGRDPIADHKARKHRLQAAIEERDARGFAAPSCKTMGCGTCQARAPRTANRMWCRCRP